MRLDYIKNIIQKTDNNQNQTISNFEKNRPQILKILKSHPTPLYIIDKNIIRNNLDILQKSLEKNWEDYAIAYSFKTNYEIAKSRIFPQRNLWAEVVSGKEYQLAKKLKYEKIIFNGPYKTDPELKAAIKDKSLTHIDHHEELGRLMAIKKSQPFSSSVGIRVRTKIKGLSPSRFGFSIDSGEAEKAVKRINRQTKLTLVSLHIHLGTDIDNPECYQEASQKIASFAQKISRFKNVDIQYLDLGGGFPSKGLKPFHKTSWHPQPIEEYAKNISQELKKTFNEKQKPTLILEPGRCLVDDAVIFVTKITKIERPNKKKQLLMTNGTITMLPLKHYRPQIIQAVSSQFQPIKQKQISSTVYGSTCQENDILYQGLLPSIRQVGSYLIYYVVGAYNQNMASEFIFNKPKIFFISGKQYLS